MTSIQIQTPTSAERTTAAAIYLSEIFLPVIGPAIGLVVLGKSSPYVRFHATKALREWFILKLALAVLATASFSYTVWHLISEGFAHFDWTAFLLRMVAAWILLAILEVLNTLQSLRQAWAAYRGS